MFRAFVGLELPENIRAELTQKQLLLPLPQRVPAELLHITLAFLGNISPDTAESVHENLLQIRAALFPLRIAGLGMFGRDRPHLFWAGLDPSPPLEAMQRHVAHAGRMAGCTIPARKFLPHVTLGRFAPPPIEQIMRLERAVAEGGDFHTSDWLADELVLWDSRRTARGPYYHVLARYPFIGFP